MKKIIFLSIALFLCLSIGMNAQVVTEKPKSPTKILTKNDVEKPPTKANWVWVSGEWEWKSKSEEYKWVEAHWAKAPEDKKVWRGGYWKKVKKGWQWEPGHFE